MRLLCDALRAGVPNVVARWDELAAAPPRAPARALPGRVLPVPERQGHLPAVVARLADAVVCDEPSPERLTALAEEAARHGEQRRRLGAPLELLADEYRLLRRALWDFFREHASARMAGAGGAAGPPAADAVQDTILRAILRVDNALLVAERAALLGYHRAEIEARGEWVGLPARVAADVAALLGDRWGP